MAKSFSFYDVPLSKREQVIEEIRCSQPIRLWTQPRMIVDNLGGYTRARLPFTWKEVENVQMALKNLDEILAFCHVKGVASQ